MLGIMVGLDQKDSYALFPCCGMYEAGIAGTVLLAMCLSLVGRPMMLGILCGMDQKESSTMSQTDILALFVGNGSCMLKAGFTGCDTPRACFLWSVGKKLDFRHHGRYGPEEHVSSFFLS